MVEFLVENPIKGEYVVVWDPLDGNNSVAIRVLLIQVDCRKKGLIFDKLIVFGVRGQSTALTVRGTGVSTASCISSRVGGRGGSSFHSSLSQQRAVGTNAIHRNEGL
jgi:hypothetical protein